MTTTAAKPAATRASYDIDVADVEYRRDGGAPILAKVFQPKGNGPFPIMIDLHGGAWCNSDRAADDMINEALARSGVVVAALDFRMPPAAAYPGSLADIHYGVRWMKARAKQMQANAAKVGIMGSSSGGHQAMLVGMRPNDARYGAHKLEGGANIDARVQCVVMMWPVIDPLGRYQYAKKIVAAGGKDAEEVGRVLPSHDKFWKTEAAMAEGAPANALESGEKVDLPPTLVVQGTADKMHPRDHLDRFTAAYRKRGGDIEVEMYQGEISGFITRSAANPANMKNGTERVVDFVHKQLG